MAKASVQGKVIRLRRELLIFQNNLHIHACMHAHTTILQLSGFCLGQPRWAGTRGNIHPLTPIVVINHPLSASFINYDPRHPPRSIYEPDNLFPQSLSSFLWSTSWHPPLHTPYISSHNHCHLFTAHAV